jgi:hypothetical protein
MILFKALTALFILQDSLRHILLYGLAISAFVVVK